MDTGYKYVLAYGIAIAVFILLLKSKIGYRLVYYLLLLSLFLVLVVESRFIASSLSPITRNTLGDKPIPTTA